MFRRLVVVIILLPVAVALVGFAVANRQPVVVSFNPFDAVDPAHSATIPLYFVAFVILIAGVVLGGVAAWLEQGKWRRARARLAAEMRTIRSELEELRQRAAAHETRAPPPRSLSGPAAKRQPAA